MILRAILSIKEGSGGMRGEIEWRGRDDSLIKWEPPEVVVLLLLLCYLDDNDHDDDGNDDDDGSAIRNPRPNNYWIV